MNEIVTNRLIIPSNAKTVLQLLGSEKSVQDSPALFSLTSIKKMPEALDAEPPSFLRPLSLMNLDLPEFEKTTQKKALASEYLGWNGKKTTDEIREKIAELQQQFNGAEIEQQALKKAEQTFQNYQYISAIDWRLDNWGITSDILTAEDSSFILPTRQIEFQTAWLPPIRALRYLADIFPSVRFELNYRFDKKDPWIHLEIFPFTPFGY